MPFQRPTIQTIYDRMISGIETRMTGNVSLLRRAILRVLAKVFAGAIHLLYGRLEWLSKQIFVTQAELDMLDRPHGGMWGITRNSAQYATGQYRFTGTNAVVIAEGTKVQNSEGIEFQTEAEVTIASGYADAVITAVEAGEAGNISDSTLELVSPIDGVDNVGTVMLAPSSGLDLETDESYRSRILSHIQHRPMGGNKYDYEEWAKGVLGVGNAWCMPLARGGGTVDVVVKAAGANPVPSPTLLSAVSTYIEDVKPVTADVSVLAINPKEVTLWISFAPNGATNTDVQDKITSNLTDLFENIAAPKTDLLISYIRDAIMNSGASDYAITQIEVNAASVPVDQDIVMSGENDYPTLGTITFATLV
jgi:uncharacterized phage protein gp47/JayE